MHRSLPKSVELDWHMRRNPPKSDEDSRTLPKHAPTPAGVCRNLRTSAGLDRHLRQNRPVRAFVENLTRGSDPRWRCTWQSATWLRIVSRDQSPIISRDGEQRERVVSAAKGGPQQ
jgi:hypothetical protein